MKNRWQYYFSQNFIQIINSGEQDKGRHWRALDILKTYLVDPLL